MLIDANLLLYAIDSSSQWHAQAAGWLTRQLNGERRVAMPWPTLTAFLRISTHPRVWAHPLRVDEAWGHIEDWLARDVVWTPSPTRHHAGVLKRLVAEAGASGNLVSDAHLGALALEHGLTVCSADGDFARFPGVRWSNPLVEV